MLRVIVVGLGPIGQACAKAIRVERDMSLVGLVDLDPSKQGKTLDELMATPGEPVPADPSGKPSPRVTNDLPLSAVDGADVAVVTTSSRLDVIAPTLRVLLDHGMAVVSSCEQMSWPWYRHAALADELDAHARAAGRALLATGVNPGFVMDTLAVALSCMVRRVRAVRCERRVEAGLRRQPLQAKIGATMTAAQFNELAAAGKIGHEGLPESVALIAAGLGRRAEPGSVKITLEPVLAEAPTPSALGLIQPGRVSGMRNTGHWSGDGLTIDLDLTMAVGLSDPKDVITLDGPVQLRLKIPGGTPGDSATVATLLNHIHVVHEAKAGLRTMLDVPPAGCRGRD
ncbi:MAG: dihydrodipicolinate reductase [Planctomycetota bacterium]|nr:dihydrodipicolinate reductase [Planctomycetota bacterium]